MADGIASSLNGQQLLGQLSLKLIEELEDEYGEEFDINIAAIALDVTWKDEDSGRTRQQLIFKSTDPRKWIQQAFFTEMSRIARK